MIKDIADIKGKKIAVIGLGKTGCSLAKFLHRHGAEVVISDYKSAVELSSHLEKLPPEISVELEGHKPKTLMEQDCVILSPGIPSLSQLELLSQTKHQGKLQSAYSLTLLKLLLQIKQRGKGSHRRV